ncbi:MAG TPA: GtrA family protein [Candidatus Binatia bacterium]|nr:GtrA family protein [Candidatus Binatia bacterium]
MKIAFRRLQRPGPVLSRWLRFNAVGALGVGVQLLALVIFKQVFCLDYLLASSLAVELAVLHNFFWHERYTWAGCVTPSRKKSLARLIRFHIGNGVISILGNLLIMRALAGSGRVNYLFANGISIALCSAANFAAGERWVFGDGSREPRSLARRHE